MWLHVHHDCQALKTKQILGFNTLRDLYHAAVARVPRFLVFDSSDVAIFMHGATHAVCMKHVRTFLAAVTMAASGWVAIGAVAIAVVAAPSDARPIAAAPAGPPWWYKRTVGNVLGPDDWHQV